MQVYRIRSGSVDAAGVWRQGSYDELFKAIDFLAAQQEVDRALQNKEIIGVETGRRIRVDGPDGSAHRSMEESNSWYFD